MELIIIHETDSSTSSANNNLLRFAISNAPVASVIFDGLSKSLRLNGSKNIMVAIPRRWDVEFCESSPKIERYSKDILLSCKRLQPLKRSCWFAISNGRFATQTDRGLIEKVLAGTEADIVAINVDPELLPYHEKVRFAAQGKVAGFRRFYFDSAEPAPVPADWPHHLFIKTGSFKNLFVDNALPSTFSEFTDRCSSESLTVRSLNIGGTVLDLNTEEGLLAFLVARLNASVQNRLDTRNKAYSRILDKDNVTVSESARLFGKILFGRNIRIGQNAIVAGPAIISDNVKIGAGAVVNSSIIGPNVSIPQNQLVQNRVVKGPQCNWKRLTRHRNSSSRRIRCRQFDLNLLRDANDTFRIWPMLSYVRCLKRIADVVAAVTVLTLFAPVFAIIALAIKLTSRGPVFFKDTRQGLHGKLFNCIKFRTMIRGSDKMQDKLRIINETDGPQFKMADDPRTSTVGRFLRDTYIDEIPQFFNVLLGQMSVVGPRPSPESENTLCPSWRDARLSVRPGITGLWQLCRTRQPMKDFQEWIYYDTKYVRDLKLRMDLWICWQTVRKLVRNFISRF